MLHETTLDATLLRKGMLHETIFNAKYKIQATMLQVFETLSKTCNMLPQRVVALKVALCANFNATISSLSLFL